MKRFALCAFVVAGLLTGCGSDARQDLDRFSAEERAAGQVVVDFYAALRSGDEQGICEVIFHRDPAPDEPVILPQERCEAARDPAQPQVPEVTVEAVTLSGSSGRVRISLPPPSAGEGPETRSFAVRRFGDRWRVGMPPLGAND